MPKDELTVELLIVIDVEMRGLPPLAPPPRVCGEVYLTLPYLKVRRTRTPHTSHARTPRRCPGDRQWVFLPLSSGAVDLCL